MSQGTSPPPADDGSTTSNKHPSGLTDNQVKAITMLMSNLGKGGQTAGMPQPQYQGGPSQTSTIQGGTFINPNAQR